ncbi:hypothetical protein CVT24_003031 [Panaeolus cyanescens]|uniref:Uncharacterized protein n=1 Tax=Panaeolus cyanescens TaxID=181874 RepID=A0A409VFP9_9AGAR|nr:hypothetical protein CVT24_003031 [Panaeolus cyanescens]
MSIPWGCDRFLKVLSTFIAIAVPATCFLFYLRLRAIFDRQKLFSITFGFLWTIVLASCLTFVFGTSASNIGATQYCIISRLEDYVASSAIIPLIYDTLVFGAITWRLTLDTHVGFDHLQAQGSPNTKLTDIVSGKFLPAFTRAILQDGQVYYLITNVVVCLTTVVILYIPDLSKIYRTMFASPDLTLMNIMACRVFRNTKFGLFRETSVPVSRILGDLETNDNRLHYVGGPIRFNDVPSTHTIPLSSGENKPTSVHPHSSS